MFNLAYDHVSEKLSFSIAYSLSRAVTLPYLSNNKVKIHFGTECVTFRLIHEIPNNVYLLFSKISLPSPVIILITLLSFKALL